MIAKDKQALITILIAEKPTESEMYAATELRHYLNLMTGASFTVTSEQNGPVIAIGQAAAALGVYKTESGKKSSDDAFVVETKGDSIGVAGGKRGAVYGVYELLESMGCRFFTPECEQIPCTPNLSLPDIHTAQEPILEYRQHNYRDITRSQRFAAKCRINSGKLRSKQGGGISYLWFVHTFDSHILDPEEHFDAHPEYFSMVDGKRVKERTQLCLTNPDVLAITVEKARTALRANPECEIISISQNDWYNNCTCPECAAIDAQEESNAGSLIWFINQVAEQLEAEFPHVIIDTLAYQYSRPAPKYIRPRHNVCVRLCSIESCFSHSFETCDDERRRVRRPDGTRTSFINDLSDWAKVCDRMYIWDYTTGFGHYPAPHPNWNVLQPNMRSFIKNNVKGVFEQACGAAGGSTDLNELRAYLLSKLLWNADCDIKRHREEFLSFYYGAAAPFIDRYLNTLTDLVERENYHVGFQDSTDKPYLSNAMLDIYDGFFDQAEKAVIGDPIRHARVAKARLSLRWVRMKNKAMLQSELDPAEMNQFFTDWRAYGLTRIDEWVSAETTLRALLENKWRGTSYYKNWWDEGSESDNS